MYIKRQTTINGSEVKEIIRAGEKICYVNDEISDKRYDEIIKENKEQQWNIKI